MHPVLVPRWPVGELLCKQTTLCFVFAEAEDMCIDPTSAAAVTLVLAYSASAILHVLR